eukprot:TRINITY_DN6719_c0_g1_i2.p1 TRINITY_DN6719_c0_g1~~TRINITY_DN6719_c0_g1_i2.p1  ORF type:complete len:253 (-),score=40.65 TRINITY_DN6719_c0_g1_i2:62-820(-)
MKAIPVLCEGLHHVVIRIQKDCCWGLFYATSECDDSVLEEIFSHITFSDFDTIVRGTFDDIDTIEIVLQILGDLSSCPENLSTQIISAWPSMPDLFYDLLRYNDDVLYLSLISRIVSNLVLDRDDVAEIFLKSEMDQIASKCLYNPKRKVRTDGFFVFHNIIYGKSTKLIDRLMESNFLKGYCSMLEDSECGSYALEGLTILIDKSDISRSNIHKKKLIEAGALDKVQQLLKSENLEIRDHAEFFLAYWDLE